MAAPRRRLLERAISVAGPRWDETLRPAPEEIAPGLWSIERRFRLPGGLALPTRSFAVRSGDALCVLSPLPDAEAQRDVAALGRVRFLVAPNSFHYGGLVSWSARFSGASLWVAPGLPVRRPELPAAHEIREGEPLPFSDALAHTVLESRGVAEVAFLHRPSRTLILTDACFHIRAAPRALDRLGLRLLGAFGRFGPARTSRAILLRDRAGVAAWIQRILRWDFERIVVAHGEVLEAGGRETLCDAFRSYL